MGKLYRLLFIALVLCIPVTSIVTAANLMFRPPDLYAYEFKKLPDTDEITGQIPEEKLAEFFSDFMWGKEEAFSYMQSEEEQENAFTINEQIIMEELRQNLNRVTIVGGISILTIVILCLLFRSINEKQALRSAYKYSLILYGIFAAGLGVLLELDRGRMMGFHWISSEEFRGDDMLPKLITEVFVRDAFWAGLAISALAMGIIAYIIWKISKPRRMF